MIERKRNEKGVFVSEGRLLHVKCLTCGRDISVYLARHKDGRGKYCSKSCSEKHCHPTGEKHHKYSEQSFRTGSGQEAFEYRYRLIAERVLGRKLKNGEVVHHIDGNRNNNANNNLLICDETYHKRLHYNMNPKPYQKGLLLGRGWQRKTIRRAA